MSQSPPDYDAVRRAVTAWYAMNGRQFLWRRENPDPYVALVAEVMLQQTQTARVAEKLPRFLEQFPDFAALAAASNAAIIRAWQGFGYNNRALRLRDCARAVMERFGGELPDNQAALASLPGVGRYTAAALQAFVFHRDTAVLDVNVRRVYSRVFGAMTLSTDALPEAEIAAVSEVIFPRGRASAWHQAVMDVGAMFCKARRTDCAACPLAGVCRSAFEIHPIVRARRPEPSRFGTPNRVWRGRATEALRKLPHGAQLTEREVFAAVAERAPNQEDAAWFAALLDALERDGIIAITPGADGERRVALRE